MKKWPDLLCQSQTAYSATDSGFSPIEHLRDVAGQMSLVPPYSLEDLKGHRSADTTEHLQGPVESMSRWVGDVLH